MINNNWQNANNNRSFPFDENASKLSDAGVRLPDNCFTTVRLAIPETVGSRVALSSLTIGRAIVTATFSAYPADLSGEGTPIAAVTASLPVSGAPVKVEGLLPGVTGWVAFGDAVNAATLSSYRFTAATAPVLSTQTVAYKAFPVTTLAVDTQPRITGDIVVGAANYAQVTANADDNSITFGLNSNYPTSSLRTLAGPCGRLPINGGCTTPPIYQINDVVPDSSGNINLTLSGSWWTKVDAPGITTIHATSDALSQSAIRQAVKGSLLGSIRTHMPTVDPVVQCYFATGVNSETGKWQLMTAFASHIGPGMQYDANATVTIDGTWTRTPVLKWNDSNILIIDAGEADSDPQATKLTVTNGPMETGTTIDFEVTYNEGAASWQLTSLSAASIDIPRGTDVIMSIDGTWDTKPSMSWNDGDVAIDSPGAAANDPGATAVTLIDAAKEHAGEIADPPAQVVPDGVTYHQWVPEFLSQDSTNG